MTNKDLKITQLSVVILASGDGSNAENIIVFAKKNPQLLSVKGVIADQASAGVIQRCKDLKILCTVIALKEEILNLDQRKKIQEEQVCLQIKKWNANWVLLAGYMKILSSTFLKEFYNPQFNLSTVINIHPSLLPQFSGKNAYKQAFDAKVKQSGVSVHFVDKGVDTGPIILQQTFVRKNEDSLKDFITRGLTVEHELYKKVLTYLAYNIVEVVFNSTLKLKKVTIKKGVPICPLSD